MGHGDPTDKASWQWDQTSNHSCLEVKAVIINLVIGLGSHRVDKISSRFHHNSFSRVSGTEISVTYISLLG